MKRLKLPCGCEIEGEPPTVHKIWLCKKHRKAWGQLCEVKEAEK